MRRIGLFLGAAALLGALMTAAPAGAAYNSFQRIFFQYQGTGAVAPCKWSSKQLAAAKKQVPNDFEQYAPDFEAALDAAIEKRASGGCRKGGGGGAQTAPATTAPGTTGTTPPASGQTTPSPPGTTPATPAATTPTVPSASTTPAPAAPTTPPAAVDDAIPAAATTAREGGASDAPLPLLLLAALCAALALAVAVLGTARWWAFEPGWYVRARHASAEAGWRASAMWAEFADWLRLGR